MKNQRKFLFIHWLFAFLLLAAASLGAVFAVNRHYDPYSVFQEANDRPALPHGLRAQMASYSYVPKAAQIIRLKPDSILLGTSVTDSGFLTPGSTANYFDSNPESFARLEREIAPHPPVFNAAVRGKLVFAAWEMLQHAYANNPNLKEVYLGIDWSSSTKPAPSAPLSAELAILGHTRITPDFMLRHSLSLSATRLSFDMWKHDHPVAASRLEKLLHILPSAVRSAFAQEPPTFQPRAQQDMNKLLLTDAQYHTSNFVFSAHYAAEKTRRTPGVDPSFYRRDSNEYLRRIADFCREKNIRLVVFVTPKHPFFWAFIRHYGVMHEHEDWLREITAITPVWDFSGQFEFGPQPETYHTTDSLHFIQTAGEVMLPQMVRNAPAPGARIVTQQNVEEVIQGYRRGLERWEHAYPALAASVHAVPLQDIVDAWAYASNHIPLMPVVYEPDYKGWRVYRFLGRFIAVPAAQANALKLTELAQYAAQGWPTALRLPELIPAIDGKAR